MNNSIKQKEIGNINITLKENTSFITLKIKGNKHYFLLDTGASSSVLDENANLITDEIVVDSDELVAGFGDTKQVNIYELPCFIDDMMVFQKFVVAPLGITKFIDDATGIKISGVIGMDFIMRYKCIIDFYNLSIKLTIEKELNRNKNGYNKEI